MLYSAPVLWLLILFLGSSCAGGNREKDLEAGQFSRDAIHIVNRFENILAEKLLQLAIQDMQAASKDDRFQIVDAHRRKLKQSLDISRLSAANKRQLRLLDYLWQSERSKSDTGKTGAELPYMKILKLKTSISSDAADLSEQAYSKLSKAHAKIRLLTDTPAGVSLRPVFKAMRNDPENYLPNTHAGRQKYLDLMVDSLTNNARLLPALYVVEHNEFTLEGDESHASELLFTYDTVTKSLNIDLRDMNQLPLYEVDSVVSYYGIPGMHTIGSIEPLEIQSMISIPGYVGGWASYVTSSLDWRRLDQRPDSELMRAYFEAMFISLAIADINLHTGNWSADQATKFVIDSSPYPATRLKKSVLMATRHPGIFSAPLLTRLEIEKLQVQSKNILKQIFILSEFHDTVLSQGLLPLLELKKIVADWTKQKMHANQSYSPAQ